MLKVEFRSRPTPTRLFVLNSETYLNNYQFPGKSSHFYLCACIELVKIESLADFYFPVLYMPFISNMLLYITVTGHCQYICVYI